MYSPCDRMPILTTLAAKILAAVCADDFLYRRLRPWSKRARKTLNWHELKRFRETGCIRVAAGRWSGLNTRNETDRKRISRAYRELENVGLLERIGDGKTTHVRLTKTGRRVGRELAAAVNNG
jgi:hypothetical protein